MKDPQSTRDLRHFRKVQLSRDAVQYEPRVEFQLQEATRALQPLHAQDQLDDEQEQSRGLRLVAQTAATQQQSQQHLRTTGGSQCAAHTQCTRRSCAVSLSVSLSVATLPGNVSNLATGNLLQGARVEIPALGVSALVDETGRYIFGSVPAGTHELVVTYLGLDSQRATVAVTADQTATRNFDLTTGIYKLEQFKVKGEREGDASALTAARNAENLKNVAATDSFGNLPNMNAGEVAIRLPGIYGELDAGGNLSGFNVRAWPRDSIPSP